MRLETLEVNHAIVCDWPADHMGLTVGGGMDLIPNPNDVGPA